MTSPIAFLLVMRRQSSDSHAAHSRQAIPAPRKSAAAFIESDSA